MYCLFFIQSYYIATICFIIPILGAAQLITTIGKSKNKTLKIAWLTLCIPFHIVFSIFFSLYLGYLPIMGEQLLIYILGTVYIFGSIYFVFWRRNFISAYLILMTLTIAFIFLSAITNNFFNNHNSPIPPQHRHIPLAT